MQARHGTARHGTGGIRKAGPGQGSGLMGSLLSPRNAAASGIDLISSFVCVDSSYTIFYAGRVDGWLGGHRRGRSGPTPPLFHPPPLHPCTPPHLHRSTHRPVENNFRTLKSLLSFFWLVSVSLKTWSHYLPAHKSAPHPILSASYPTPSYPTLPYATPSHASPHQPTAADPIPPQPTKPHLTAYPQPTPSHTPT